MIVLRAFRQCNAGRQDEILAEMVKTEAEMLDAALQLSRQRQAAVQPLKEAVESCLADLAMPGSCFDIAFRWECTDEVFISAMTFSALLNPKTSSGSHRFCMSSGVCKLFVKVISVLASSSSRALITGGCLCVLTCSLVVDMQSCISPFVFAH